MRFGQAAAFVALWRIAPWVKPYVSAATRSKGEHDDLITNNEELRIVMVGKTGAGKSATGNTILGFKAFESKFRSKSVTANCLKVRGVAGRNAVSVAVIDTPGLFDTTYSRKETIQEILQCLSFASPGPHVFLIVIKLDRFTKEEQRSVQLIQQMFGQSSHAYSMILFTNGDRVVDETVEEMLKDDPVLRGIVDTCNGRYHVFNNTIKDPSQVNELIDKIKQINGGSHYTTEMFQTAERALGLVKQIILRERKEEIQKDMAELEKKYERNMQDIDEMIKKQQEKAERVAGMNEEKRRHKEMEEIKNKYESMRVALAAKEDEETRRKEAEEELKRQYEREAQEKEEKLKKEQQEEQERIVREMEETKCKELEEQKKAHEREMKEMQDRYEREARGTAELHTFTIIGRFIGKHIAGEPGSKVGAAVGKVLADVTSLTGSCSIQ